VPKGRVSKIVTLGLLDVTLDLRDEGLSLRAIADRLNEGHDAGVDHKTVERSIKAAARAPVPPPPRPEVLPPPVVVGPEPDGAPVAQATPRYSDGTPDGDRHLLVSVVNRLSQQFWYPRERIRVPLPEALALGMNPELCKELGVVIVPDDLVAAEEIGAETVEITQFIKYSDRLKAVQRIEGIMKLRYGTNVTVQLGPQVAGVAGDGARAAVDDTPAGRAVAAMSPMQRLYLAVHKRLPPEAFGESREDLDDLLAERARASSMTVEG